jgi:hypothetical protein
MIRPLRAPRTRHPLRARTPPLYCPDNPVTRGQMAVFLATALGLHWKN